MRKHFHLACFSADLICSLHSLLALSHAEDDLQNHTAPPKPLNSNITIFNGYGGVYAVTSFGGFADQPSISAYASALSGNLTAAGISYTPQIYQIVYDDPLR